jgi:RHS repeat-associated protein
VTFGYDPTYQLTNEQRSGVNSYNISYTYDPVGNRTLLLSTGAPTTSTYNAGNELVTSQTSAGVTTSAYDGSGNLLTSLAPGNQRTTNTWDGENRLTLVALPSGIVDSFAYNGDGLRVQKQDSTGTTKHVWDAENMLLETDGLNMIAAVYTLQPLQYGNLISQRLGSVTSYFAFDVAGSARYLLGAAGTPTDTYLYTSFGVMISSSGNTANHFLYGGKVGYYFDNDTSTYYLRRRVYSGVLGCFFCRDFPPRDPLYVYCANNPTNCLDPSGLGIVIPVLLPIIVGGLACLGYLCYKRESDWVKSLGATTPSNTQQRCINAAIKTLNQAVWINQYPDTSVWNNCAKSVWGVYTPSDPTIDGETGVLCHCTGAIVFNKTTATCATCQGFINLIDTCAHECRHRNQDWCSDTSIAVHESDAYRWTAKLLKSNKLRICESAVDQGFCSTPNDCYAAVAAQGA